MQAALPRHPGVASAWPDSEDIVSRLRSMKKERPVPSAAPPWPQILEEEPACDASSQQVW